MVDIHNTVFMTEDPERDFNINGTYQRPRDNKKNLNQYPSSKKGKIQIVEINSFVSFG